ncbi:MAG: sigma-70 family RNA polymerase sigma factor [Bacteroidales bacterium]|nr:sigma-70 family RNA polymerase sigma factor [Bacteroidales bacterium]
MDRNQIEIKLLKSNPRKLLLKYQSIIWMIVRDYFSKGMVRFREQEDLVQEINKKLLERMPRIQAQYNYTSKLRTYFSVIIRNICLEEYRKIGMVSEADPIPYLKTEAAESPVDLFLFNQEYERLQRIIVLFNKEQARFNLLLKVINNMIVVDKDLDLFPGERSDEEQDRLLKEIDTCKDQIKKKKYIIISQVLTPLEGKYTTPESLRKWYSSRLDECLKLMNGNPPTSSYTADSIGLLLEQAYANEK